MELRQLRYFVAVAEELSFRRAAERLHLAQPALSAQVKNLENQLDVKLLERTTRTVRLTAAGRALLQEARNVLGAVTQAEQSAKQAHIGLVGTLRLGMIAPTATPRLANTLREHRQRFPGVQLALYELTSAEQLRRLRAGELDVGLLRPPVAFSELNWINVEESRLVLAAPAGHRLTVKRKIEWADFDGEGLVMIQPGLQHGFYDGFLTACSQAGAKVHPAIHAHDIQTKMWLISAGFGVAPTSVLMMEVKRPGLVFRELPSGLPPIKTALVWRGVDESPLVRNFLELYRSNNPQAGKPQMVPMAS
ncbi:MAG TPA: LysR family transcriptional regulator [Verrucomicrobiae bacterium]